MLSDIFHFIVMYVCSLNYISAAINWKWKEAVVFDIIFRLNVYSEENCSSQGELTEVIKYAAVCRITGLASSRPWEFTLPSRTCKVRTTEDVSLKLAYLHACRTTSPDYLPNLQDTLDRDGKADSNRSAGKKSSWDKLFQVISVEKHLMYILVLSND